MNVGYMKDKYGLTSQGMVKQLGCVSVVLYMVQI